MLKRVFLSAIFLCSLNHVNASPWINADDKYLHSSIQVLQKAGHLNLPLSSYPLSWVSVLEQLASIDRSQLTQNEIVALQRILSLADFAQQEHIQTLVISGSTEPVSSGLQGARFDEAALLSVMSEHKGHNWAFGVRSNLRIDSRDDKEHHFDGSYLAYTYNNWVISLAQQPLWLGNMHVHSEQFNWQGRAPKTIQINNLNPLRGLFSEKISRYPVSTKFIYGEMPKLVSLENAKFVVATTSIKPSLHAEVALSFSQLSNIPDVATEQMASNRSNVQDIQLDAKYQLGALGVYGQWIKQDNLEKQSDQFSLGTDYHTWLNNWQSTFFIEQRHFKDGFFNWRQPESFQESPFAQVQKLARNTAAGAYFYQADGVGVSLKVSHLRYVQNPLVRSQLLYNLSAQYPLFNGLITAEVKHSAKKAETDSARWQGAIRFEYRW